MDLIHIIFLLLIYVICLSKLVSGLDIVLRLTRHNQNRITTVYTSGYTRSLIHCSVFCTRDINCGSATYNVATGECQLSALSGQGVVDDMAADMNCLVFTKTDCGEPPVKTNSVVLAGKTTIGSQRQYQCHSQHVPTSESDVSTMSVKCLASGSWTPTNFECVIECEEPGSITNVQISSGPASGVEVEGDTRAVSCVAGYATVDGNSEGTITCQSDGTWTANSLECLIDCNSPPSLTGADISGSNTLQDSARTYQCQSDHQPENAAVTSAIIICSATGSWTMVNPLFNCLRECDDPPEKSNADTSAAPSSGKNVEGETRTYSCKPGYGVAEGSDSGVITCQATGGWTSSNLACVAGTVTSQWVSSVVAYSSEWQKDHGGYYASQVIGEHNVYPSHGDIAGAWCSENGESNGYIEVLYLQAVYVTEVGVYETFHAGGLKKIQARDSGGSWYTLWNTTNIQDIHSARIFSPTLQYSGAILSNRIKLDIDFTHWMQIDAIQLTGTRYV